MTLEYMRYLARRGSVNEHTRWFNYGPCAAAYYPRIGRFAWFIEGRRVNARDVEARLALYRKRGVKL